LHFQKEPYAQAKLVRCPVGKILDVAVDIRRNSPTLGKYISLELSEKNHLQLFIPKGFAHGFSVVSESAIVEYKCDEAYNSDYDAGLRYDDPEIGIDWKVKKKNQIVSQKDRSLPFLKDLYKFNDQ